MAAEAIVTTIVSVVVTEALKKILETINKEKRTVSVESIKQSINTVNKSVKKYENLYKDRGDWQDKIAELRCSSWDIEDCIDKFKINKLSIEDFLTEVTRIKAVLDEQSRDIEEYHKRQQEGRPSSEEITRIKTVLEKQLRDIKDYIRRYLGSSSQNFDTVITRINGELENLSTSSSRKEFATEITGMKRELQKLSNDVENHIHQRQQGSSSGSSNGQRPTGIDEPLDDLLALVRNASNQQAKNQQATNQQVTGTPQVTMVISIVGTGGIGKTCLVTEVYHHQEVRQSFPLRAFVRAIGMNRQEVLRQLPTGLRSRSANQSNRCFIVVDDVQDKELGGAVISELREVTRADDLIIMTTTVQEFAKSWSSGGGHVYKMRPLSVELSGRLFKGHYTGVDKPESREVWKECDGVPLAVITRARNWDEYREDVWSQVCDLSSPHNLQRMAQVVQHSYSSLPTIGHQTCLLYFSLFQREHAIRRGSLIRRWMAEGSEVGCGNVNNNHITAFKNWKGLVDRNVLCPIRVSINEEDQGAKTWRPSRAMLGYISHKSRRLGFARVCRGESLTTEVIRRLSLQTNDREVWGDMCDASRFRTLVVDNKEIKAADLRFDKCQLLRVLELEACSGPDKRIVEDVCDKLKLLRYLGLRLESLSFVPRAITELKELETLDVGKEKVVFVPADVLMLPKLKHLIGKIRGTGFQGEPGDFKAKNLVTLAGFMTETAKGFPSRIQYMKNLRKVKVFFDPKASANSLSSYSFRKSSRSSRLAEAVTAFLRESADHYYEDQRRSLSIDIQDCNKPASALSSLENAQGKLYSLKLCGSKSVEFHKFFGKLNGIEKLCISFHTLSWKAIIDCQNSMPDLKYLKLVAKESFIGVFKQAIAGQSTVTEVLPINRNQFKKLQRMCLQSANTTLPKIEIEVGALTDLVSLHLISDKIGEPSAVICKRNSTNGIIPPVNNLNQVAHEIPPLDMLKEVALQSSSASVTEDIEKAWHEAARRHTKSPQVLFIEDA